MVDEAISLYRAVIETDANHAAAHLNLGFLPLDKGYPAGGQAELLPRPSSTPPCVTDPWGTPGLLDD